MSAANLWVSLMDDSIGDNCGDCGDDSYQNTKESGSRKCEVVCEQQNYSIEFMIFYADCIAIIVLN